MLLPPPRSTLFPYTTLFRSQGCSVTLADGGSASLATGPALLAIDGARGVTAAVMLNVGVNATFQQGYTTVATGGGELYTWERSEEHTSELQSLTNLVCRLLL